MCDADQLVNSENNVNQNGVESNGDDLGENKVPWPGFSKFFEFHSKQNKTIRLKCKLCAITKILSGDITTNSNFAKHIKNIHKAEEELKESVRTAKSVLVTNNSTGVKLQKQLTIKQCIDEVKVVTQKMLDEKILNCVIDEVTPKFIVEKAAFKELVLMGLPKNLKVMCRKMLV